MTPEKSLRLKPAAGRKVRRPDGQVLSADGEFVTPGPYWDRRLADDDVVKAPAAPAKTAKKEA